MAADWDWDYLRERGRSCHRYRWQAEQLQQRARNAGMDARLRQVGIEPWEWYEVRVKQEAQIGEGEWRS